MRLPIHRAKWIQKRFPKQSIQQLKNNQIFILPSMAGYVFLILLGLILLIGINFQNTLAYALTFWLFSLFLLNILHTWRNLSGLQIRSSGVCPVFCEETAQFKVLIQGSQRAHHSITLCLDEQKISVDCQKMSSVELILQFYAAQRGVLILPRFRIESRYPLGLAIAWSYIDLDHKTIVYPKPIAQLPRCPPMIHSNAQQDHDNHVITTRTGVDDFAGLKHYQAGESLYRIAWQAYSKGRGLFIKAFHDHAGEDIWLDLDQFEGDIETQLSALCYWVIQYTTDQKKYGLKLQHLLIQPNIGYDHRENVLGILALYREKHHA